MPMGGHTTTYLPQVPLPEIPMESQYHAYDRMAHHWIHNVNILFPWLPPNLKDDPWVDPYQSIPQKFPNYYFWHSMPYLLNPPRNTHPHSPMQPPISEQDLPDSTTQAKPTFYQTQHRPQPIPDVLAGNMKHPQQPDPPYCWHVPCLTSQHLSQSNWDRMATMVDFQLLVITSPQNWTHHILHKDTCIDMDQSPWPLESTEQWPPHCNSPITTKNAFQFQWNLWCTWQATSSHPGQNFSSIQGRIASKTQIVHWDWILHSTKYIQNKLRTIAKQNQLNMQDIQQFFNPA